MRRLTAWIGGAAAGIVAYRLLRRRPRTAAEPISVEPDERADELREKLAESREAEGAAEPVVEEESTEEPEPESPDDRRRRVHDEGRAALDEMKPE